MRKHVTPADPGASIPDPARGRDLPAEGADITWNAYWAGLAMRGDVAVSDVAVEPDELAAEADAAALEEPAAPAEVDEPEVPPAPETGRKRAR